MTECISIESPIRWAREDLAHPTWARTLYGVSFPPMAYIRLFVATYSTPLAAVGVV